MIVFDTQLLVKKAFFALLQNGMNRTCSVKSALMGKRSQFLKPHEQFL